jgi:hypothetical protein
LKVLLAQQDLGFDTLILVGLELSSVHRHAVTAKAPG